MDKRVTLAVDSTDSSALVALAQSGDREAFGQLVLRYGQLVHGLCRGMTGSAWDAQDLAHDAFVEAWLEFPSLRDPARFTPWLRSLTLNVCRMWHRSRRREREEQAEARTAEMDGGEEQRECDDLSNALSRLSSEHRLALALHYGEELSYGEIAAFLDVPIGTVMSRLHRARENLKKRMREMSESEREPSATGAGLRQSVDAEIAVLLDIWKEEAGDAQIDSRYRSATCKRLSVLLSNSPDLLRLVLSTMDQVLTEHVAIRLRQIGIPAIEVALACAFAEEEPLRINARRALCRVFGKGPEQGNTRRHSHRPGVRRAFGRTDEQSDTGRNFRLPLRRSASLILDGLIRAKRSDREKAELLVELLTGCEDGASTHLACCVLLGYAEQSFPLLWQRWWEEDEDAASSVFLAALGRFGSRFLDVLAGVLDDDDPQRLRQALIGVEAATGRLAHAVLTDAEGPDPDLVWRGTGRMRREDIDPDVQRSVCAKLAILVGDERQELRDAAIAVLGLLGGSATAPDLRPCLRHADLSTRVASIFVMGAIKDESSVPDLLRIACGDELPARRAALHVLGLLSADAARDLLIESVDDDAVRPQAISALGEIDDGKARERLRELTKNADKKIARLASNALYGGRHRSRPVSEKTRKRLDKVRGEGAQPLLQKSLVAAIRNLPEIRPYPEAELTRLIGEVCSDYSTTRRELVMDGLMKRENGIYELGEDGQAVWRVERFIKERGTPLTTVDACR